MTVLVAACGDNESTTDPPSSSSSSSSGGASTSSSGGTSSSSGSASSSSGSIVGGVPTGDFGAINAWLQKKEYQAWPKESAPRPFTPGGGGHSGTVRTYLNPTLDASMKARNAEHPKGSASVKEFFDGDTLTGWAAYVKTEDASDGGKGFYWYEAFDTTPGAGGIGGQGSTTCTGCHSRGKDYVLVAYPLQ